MTRVVGRCVLLLVGVLAPASNARGGDNFLVVERVDRLTLYNTYQQEATSRDRSAFAPFIAMKILKENDLLSDGYTRCMQVEIGGTVFYLLKNQEGRLAYSGNAGFEQTFINVRSSYDTVQILTDHSFFLSPINSSRRSAMHRGERIVRVFLQRDMAYCQALEGTPTYGWVDFRGKREGKDWAVFTSREAAATVIPDGVVQKIRTRVNEVNDVFMKLFGYFNTQTRQKKQAPRWDLQTTPTSIECILACPDSPDNFQQSTLYLAKDIENFTLGAELVVEHSPGRIEVTTRGEHESQAH